MEPGDLYHICKSLQVDSCNNNFNETELTIIKQYEDCVFNICLLYEMFSLSIKF
jgi:hypothetical protein